jgi:hypothetical protein
VVKRELTAKHVKPGRLVLPPGGGELRVYPSGQPYVIKFNLHTNSARSARLQTGTYLAVARELKKQHLTPKHYIDVRVPGRAYYR